MKNNNELDIFFLGDTYFGEWHMRLRNKKGKSNILEEKGYLHFGKKFKKLLNNGDLVIGNLECAITEREEPYFRKEKVHVYAAKEVETLDALKDLNISVLTLANNHACDYEKEGLLDTMNALKNVNISYIGAGNNKREAMTPLFFKNEKIPNFELIVISAYQYNKTNSDYGFYASDNSAGTNVIDIEIINAQVKYFKKKYPNSFIVFIPHWGGNYMWRSRQIQKYANQIMHGDTDLIIGHSAHMIQEVEMVYKKLVVYSIGNFLFNGDGEYKARRLPPFSFIARLNVTINNNKQVKKIMLYPFLSDNIATDFTPRFVTHKEFEHIKMILASHRYYLDNFYNDTNFGKDMYGFYFEYSI